MVNWSRTSTAMPKTRPARPSLSVFAIAPMLRGHGSMILRSSLGNKCNYLSANWPDPSADTTACSEDCLAGERKNEKESELNRESWIECSIVFLKREGGGRKCLGKSKKPRHV
jgi:hypothetical protein